MGNLIPSSSFILHGSQLWDCTETGMASLVFNLR